MVKIENVLKTFVDTIKKVSETSQLEYTGIVTEVISGNSKAKVKMANENVEFVFLNKSGETLLVGDSVIIKAINGNLSNAYISLRFGESTSAEIGYASLTTSGIINSTDYTYLRRTYDAGNYSVAIGYGALKDNSGDLNIGIGNDALYYNLNGYQNIAIGNRALYTNSSGSHNVAIGREALLKNTDSFNVAIGSFSLSENTTGNQNVGVGFRSLNKNTTGYFNTAIGVSADVSNGSIYNSTMIGNNAISSASNQIVLGSSGITSLRCNVTSITSLSDTRIKEDIKLADTQMCLDTVLSLPVNRYKYKDYTGTHLDKHVTGWLADDVEKVFPKAVQVADEMFNELDENGNIVYDENGEEKRFKMENVKNITMTEAVPTLWGAVQRLYELIK